MDISKSNRTPESLPGRIAAAIAGWIVDGALVAGDTLPSGRELAQRFTVSRSVIREALARLEAQGLITISPRRGVYVAPTQPNDVTEQPPRRLPAVVEVSDLFDVRRLLEPAAASWAARRAEPDVVARLRGLSRRFEEAVAAHALERAAEADVVFHLELAACAGNPLLERLIEQLYGARRLHAELRTGSQARAEAAAREHAAIVDAVAARDPTRSADAMAAHLRAAEAAARSTLAPEPEID